MNPIRKAREKPGFNIERLQKYLQSYPDLNQEIQSNLEKYGTPFLSSTYEGRRKEDLARDLENLLYAELPELLEIIIKPEDPTGHHWQIGYHVLTTNSEGKLIRTIDKGRMR